jgi:hypothetical protein
MFYVQYDKIASSFDLWCDYIDPNATSSRADFDAMSHADRVALIIETFGPDPERVPTVDEILADTAIANGWHRWAVEGGSITVTTTLMRQLLEAAYDAADSDWVALVDAEQPWEGRADG